MNKNKTTPKFWVYTGLAFALYTGAFFAIKALLSFLEVFNLILREGIDNGMSAEFKLIFSFGFMYVVLQLSGLLLGAGRRSLRLAKMSKNNRF
jgi:hypothetical protein